jgi:hypothetical protein
LVVEQGERFFLPRHHLALVQWDVYSLDCSGSEEVEEELGVTRRCVGWYGEAGVAKVGGAAPEVGVEVEVEAGGA